MHWLVAGKTGYCKSRLLMTVVVPGHLAQQQPVAVLDRLRQPWRATWQTDDPYEYLERMQRSKGCVGVWDECGTQCHSEPKLARDLEYLATVARNDGHVMYFVSQRVFLVPPTFRYQCSNGYLFHLAGRDAKEAAELFSEPILETELPKLEPGECIIVRERQRPVKTRFFTIT